MRRLAMCICVFAVCCKTVAATEPAETVRVILDEMASCDGNAYVAARAKLLASPGAEKALLRIGPETDWLRRTLARAALAWLREGEEIAQLLADERIVDAAANMVGRPYNSRATTAAAKCILSIAGESVQDETLAALLAERVLRSYQTRQWKEGVARAAKKATRGAFRDAMARNLVLSEPTLWRLAGIRALSSMGTRTESDILLAAALRSAEPDARALASESLGLFRDRPAVAMPGPGPVGKMPVIGNVGSKGTMRAWEEKAISFTDGEMELIWFSLLVITRSDSSAEVRRVAADSLGRNPRFVPAIPFLKTAIADMPQGEVRAAAERSLSILEAAEARQAQE